MARDAFDFGQHGQHLSLYGGGFGESGRHGMARDALQFAQDAHHLLLHGGDGGGIRALLALRGGFDLIEHAQQLLLHHAQCEAILFQHVFAGRQAQCRLRQLGNLRRQFELFRRRPTPELAHEGSDLTLLRFKQLRGGIHDRMETLAGRTNRRHDLRLLLLKGLDGLVLLLQKPMEHLLGQACDLRYEFLTNCRRGGPKLREQDLERTLTGKDELLRGEHGVRDTPARRLNGDERSMLLLLERLHGLLRLLQEAVEDFFRKARNLGRHFHLDRPGRAAKLPKQDLQGALAAERDLFGGQGGFGKTPPRLLNRAEHGMLLLLEGLHGLLRLLQKLRHDLFREARNLWRQLHADGCCPGPKLTEQGLERPPLTGSQLVRGQERLTDTLARTLNGGEHLLLLA